MKQQIAAENEGNPIGDDQKLKMTYKECWEETDADDRMVAATGQSRKMAPF